MVEIEQTALPGIGTRHVIVAQSGRRVGVVTHRNGRRELVIYEADDPDTAAASLTLTSDEADTLAELLGAPRIVQRLARMHRELEGLVSEQMIITSDSRYVGRTLGDTQARTRTGASIVAVVRGGEVHASPWSRLRVRRPRHRGGGRHGRGHVRRRAHPDRRVGRCTPPRSCSNSAA